MVTSPVRHATPAAKLKRARSCYDHLAGEQGVRLFDELGRRGFLRGERESLEVTPAGRAWLGDLGVNVDALERRPRVLVRRCRDWTERRDHLAGALGAAILERLVALRFVRRSSGSRAVSLSRRGEAFLATLAVPR